MDKAAFREALRDAVYWLNASGRSMVADQLQNAADAVLSETAEHVAWCRYVRGPTATAIVLCDSDTPKAFKVYRSPPSAEQPKRGYHFEKDYSGALPKERIVFDARDDKHGELIVKLRNVRQDSENDDLCCDAADHIEQIERELHAMTLRCHAADRTANAALSATLKSPPIICYAPCKAHEGMSWTQTVVGFAQTVVPVCPICNPPPNKLLEYVSKGSNGKK